MIRKSKFMLSVLICMGILLLTACGAGNQQVLGTYLEPYEQEAIAFLQADEEFLSIYGSDCDLDASSYSYSYVDPEEYSNISLSPKIPATAEEFRQDVKDIQVNFYLPDDRACGVLFAKTPEGDLEVTGWEYTDEE